MRRVPTRLLSACVFACAVLALLFVGHAVRARVTASFVFAGSDSYGYNKLADELLAHHRYALDPAPAPLHWARPPGYPLYVALTKGRSQATMSGGDGWFKIVRANVAVELLGTGLFLCFAVWTMSGTLPALIALLLMMVGPFNAIATPAALTETLASFLVTATIAMLVPPAMGSTRRSWFIAAGAFFALGTLTRPDTLLILPSFGFAVLAAVRARATGTWIRAALGYGLAALLAFALVFAPWPIRNLIQFGKAHPLGGRIDRYSRPVENYEGSWAFLRSISRNWQPMTRLTTCYYDLACQPTVADFVAAEPALSDEERAELDRLLVRRRTEGHSRAVSDGFQRLADARRRAHPFRVEVTLPALRLKAMWIADHDELLPPHAPVASWRPWLRPLSKTLTWGAILGAALLLLERRTRLVALVLGAATLGRTALMAYTFYSMPRYLLESVPAAYALIAGGLGVLLLSLASFGSALLRARSRTKATSGVESASMKT